MRNKAVQQLKASSCGSCEVKNGSSVVANMGKSHGGNERIFMMSLMKCMHLVGIRMLVEFSMDVVLCLHSQL